MLRRRLRMCWLRRWRRTRIWRGWRVICARRTPGFGRRTRSRRLSWTGCALTWRFYSGWCSGGRRSGRGRGLLAVRMRPAVTGSGAGRQGRQARPGGPGGAAGLLASAPVQGGLGLSRGRVLLPGVRGAVHAAGRSCRGAAGLAGDRAGAGGLPAPVPAGLRLPGPGAVTAPGTRTRSARAFCLTRSSRCCTWSGSARVWSMNSLVAGLGRQGADNIAGHAGGDVRAGRDAAGPAGGGHHRAVAGLVAPAR